MTLQSLMKIVHHTLLRELAAHERDVHHNLPWQERVGILVFLGHSFGVRGERLRDVEEELAEYDAHCPGCPACSVPEQKEQSR